MPRDKALAAIDIGSSKITTLIANFNKEGQLTIVGVSTVPSKGIRKGQVVNIEESVSAISESLEQAERMAGFSVPSAFVSIGGSSISSLNSRGVVAVSGGDGEINGDDVDRVVEAARAISVPSSREIIHVVPRGFIVDSQEGIKDPVGMNGVRLEVETHIISSASTSIRNLVKCLASVNLDVEQLVFSGLASAEATLTDTEKELGVALVDIGGGTTSVCLYLEGAIAHSAVLPIGGKNITNDLAIGLRASLETAEAIKLKLTSIEKSKKNTKLEDEESSLAEFLEKSKQKKNNKEDDVLDFSDLGIKEDVGELSRKTLVDGIIKPRLTEIYTLIGMEIKRAGFSGKLPSGIVLTGGGAQTIGIAQVGKEILRMPVRVAEPKGLTGLVDEISTPEYSTVVGLLHYGEHSVPLESGRMSLPVFKTTAFKGILGKAIDWIKGFLP